MGHARPHQTRRDPYPNAREEVQEGTMDRVKLRLLLAGSLAALFVVVGIAMAGVTRSGLNNGAALGPGIPSATVKFAYYPCCADTSLPVVGMRKGFFKDVGITISPTDGYQWSQAAQFLPSMQRGQFDVATAFSTTWLQTLNTFGLNLPPVALYDVYLGRDILLAPDSPLKSTAEYMKQGLSFKAAAKKAVAAIKGKTIFTDPFAGTQPPYYDILLSYGGLTAKDIKFTFLSDDKILAASATPGRVELAFPLGAPVLVAMIRSGYRELINMGEILKYDPTSSQAVELMKETGNQTVMTQRKFLTQHHDTLLRFVSVVFRSAAYVTNPKTALVGDKIVADTINAAQGLKLIPADVATIYKTVDPLFTWEQQASTVWNPKSPFYAPRGYATAVQALIANKTLAAGNYRAKLKQFLAAADVYKELVSLQKQADKLFKQTAGVKGSNKSLVVAARKYYSWYDFLDAVRFLKAALGKG
jgi:ABC-type nitrate/sulfonate/bicarbonate transport system substrate-binding protein